MESTKELQSLYFIAFYSNFKSKFSSCMRAQNSLHGAFESKHDHAHDYSIITVYLRRKLNLNIILDGWLLID